MQIGPNELGVRLAMHILHVKVTLLASGVSQTVNGVSMPCFADKYLGRQSYSNYHRSAMYLQCLTQILLRLT